MNTYVAAEIISKETNVRFYAITNNGRQKRLIADWYIHDTAQLMNSKAGMCAGLWMTYKSGKVVCYAVEADGTETLIDSCCFGYQSQGMQAAI